MTAPGAALDSYALPVGCRCTLCAASGAGSWSAAPSTAAASVAPHILALLPSTTPIWGAGPVGTAASITYSFLTAVPSYASASDANGFAAMSATQQTAVRAALALWAEVAGITFTEAADADGVDIRIGTNDQDGVSSGYAWYPGTGSGGDIYIANDSPRNASPTEGTFGFVTLLHEIGHALGLKHPGNYNAGGGGTEGPYLSSSEDTHQYTVMSYYAHASLGSYARPVGPGLYDIAAIQYLYGANATTRADDSAYAYSDVSNAFLATIWDAGGDDTIDASAQTRGVAISLTAGSFSSIGVNGTGGSASNNVAIAYGVTIENATGGSGNDIISGNASPNVLTGGGGDDTLTGGGGDDTIIGGDGTDTAVFSGARSAYDIAVSGGTVTVTHQGGGANGADTLTGVETLRFSDRRVGLAAPVIHQTRTTALTDRAEPVTSFFLAVDTVNTVTRYELVDATATAGSGRLTYQGATQAAATTLSVTAAELADVRFVGGTAGGADSIDVRAFNDVVWSGWTRLTVTNLRPNAAPTVQANRSLTLEESAPAAALGITVPTDPDGDAVTISILGLPSGGTLRTEPGTAVTGRTRLTASDLAGLTFTPTAGFSGSAGSFLYEASDGQGGSAIQSVAIDVVPLASRLAGFDPLVYLASHPDLAAAFGTNETAARSHYIAYGRFESRPVALFDPFAYIAVNQDLAGALGTDRTAALRHYITQGRIERRSATGFNAFSYLAANPDLVSAFGVDRTAALEHYLVFGRREARTMAFNHHAYLAANPDLLAVYGSDEGGAAEHYLVHGRRERRPTAFDGLAYAASHADLLAAFGADSAAATRHYVTNGWRENRAVTFNARSYLAANPDVTAAFGTDLTAATLHYIRHGHGEGRATAPANRMAGLPTADGRRDDLLPVAAAAP